MIHLQSIGWREAPDAEAYPFALPAIRSLLQLDFSAPVTFFVGENGSGKSTLLESIAAASQSITVGAESVQTDPTLEPARQLAKYLRLSWARRTRKGFFLRAEDFLHFARRINRTRMELEAESRDVSQRFAGRGYAETLAQLPIQGSLRALEHAYGAGEGLEARSHGEGFFDLFRSRLTPNGLYLLDEPETPLSPMRQIAFLGLIHDAVAQDCQFIIATHSPILMSYPGAAILSFDTAPLSRVPYEELEHVRLTRDFLQHPEAFLRNLFENVDP